MKNMNNSKQNGLLEMKSIHLKTNSIKFRLFRKRSEVLLLPGLILLISCAAMSGMAANCAEQVNVIHNAGITGMIGGIPIGMSAIIIPALGVVYLGSSLAGSKNHKNDNPEDRCSEFK
jgi:hypothetical protein